MNNDFAEFLREHVPPKATPMGLDWSRPATELRDDLVEIWFERWKVERDSDGLARAEAWADQMIAHYAL